MIDEGDEVSQPLLDALLARLLQPARDARPAAYRRAKPLRLRAGAALNSGARPARPGAHGAQPDVDTGLSAHAAQTRAA
jgi:hypothetical protein